MVTQEGAPSLGTVERLRQYTNDADTLVTLGPSEPRKCVADCLCLPVPARDVGTPRAFSASAMGPQRCRLGDQFRSSYNYPAKTCREWSNAHEASRSRSNYVVWQPERLG